MRNDDDDGHQQDADDLPQPERVKKIKINREKLTRAADFTQIEIEQISIEAIEEEKTDNDMKLATALGISIAGSAIVYFFTL